VRVRKIAMVVFLLSAFALAATAAPVNPAEYNVNIHVRASRVLCDTRAYFSELDVVIGGKKYTLECCLGELLSLWGIQCEAGAGRPQDVVSIGSGV
jgi:hypothetical protein